MDEAGQAPLLDVLMEVRCKATHNGLDSEHMVDQVPRRRPLNDDLIQFVAVHGLCFGPRAGRFGRTRAVASRPGLFDIHGRFGGQLFRTRLLGTLRKYDTLCTSLPDCKPSGQRQRHDKPVVQSSKPVSYTHLRAHETRHDLVCRLLLEKKKNYYSVRNECYKRPVYNTHLRDQETSN